MKGLNFILCFMLVLPALSQICNNTCGTDLVYNNRCDELGANPLCLPGTDCADCQMMFPTWQIVIASISLFILVVSVAGLFCFRETAIGTKTTPVDSKPANMKEIKVTIENKEPDVQRSKNAASKKPIDAQTSNQDVLVKPGAPRLPSSRTKQ